MDNSYSQSNQVKPSGNAPGYMLWLVQGILQIFQLCCCGCIQFIFGILTIIYASQANKAFKECNLITYKEKIRLAKILNIIGWVLGIIITLVLMFGAIPVMFGF